MFSKQAADKLQELFDNLFRTAEGRGDDERKDKLAEMMPVTEAMIPMNKIVGITMKKGETEAGITIDAIRKKFSKMVTRVPVFRADESIRCIIHQSLLYKFIADKCCKPDELQAKPPIELDKLDLEQLLNVEEMRTLAVDSLVFVPATATLADAKAAMDKKEHCQDVFITEKGVPSEPVLGWLTNVGIAKHLEA